MKTFLNDFCASNFRNGSQWKQIPLLLLLTCVLVLPGCGGDQLPPEPEDGVLVYACMNPQDKRTQAMVSVFNRTHEDTQIEVRDYSGQDGVQRLLVEMAAGRVPDILDLHYFGKNGQDLDYTTPGSSKQPADEFWMPYRQLVQKGYLEDLWPYIENDPELGRDKVLEPPLKAAEVNGGLYMLFEKVRINTLMGAERVVGDRYGWTFDELMEAFATMPEDSTILRYTATSRDIFFNLLRYSLDQYVDWEIGECRFDSDEFRNMLAFLKCFPSEFDVPKDAEEEIIWRLQTGRQMLEGIQLGWPSEIIYCNALWKDRAAFVGYPTADGRAGSLFYPRGCILAMSSTCRDKEAAWEFLRQMIRRHYSMSSVLWPGVCISINLEDFQLLIRADLRRADLDRVDFKNSFTAIIPWNHFTKEPRIYPMAAMTEEDVQRYVTLINSITLLHWPNDDLANTVWETIGPYLAGDKTMDQTIDLLNNRVSLYVHEQM